MVMSGLLSDCLGLRVEVGSGRTIEVEFGGICGITGFFDEICEIGCPRGVTRGTGGGGLLPQNIQWEELAENVDLGRVGASRVFSSSFGSVHKIGVYVWREMGTALGLRTAQTWRRTKATSRFLKGEWRFQVDST